MTESKSGSAAPPKPPENWTEVWRGFGAIDMADLKPGQFVTASGLRDGGFIVWRERGDN